MADDNLFASCLAVYHTGATRVGGWQESVDACLGGKQAGTRAGGLKPTMRLNPIYGIRIERIAGRCGTGVANLRADTTDSLSFQSPGDSAFGTAVAIANGETKTLLSDTTDEWIVVTRASTEDLTGTEQLLLSDTFNCAIGGPNFVSEDSTDYTYIGLILKNTSDLAITNLIVTHPDTDWISVANEATSSDAIQTIADKYTAPSGPDFTAEWPGAGVSLAAGATVGLWIRFEWDATISARKEVLLQIDFDITGHVGQSADQRGLTRRGQASTAGYCTFVGEDDDPDFDSAPTTFSATTPYVLDAFTAGHTYTYETLYRNQFGLLSEERETESRVIGGDGSVSYPPPAGPRLISVTAIEDGKVAVTAMYMPHDEGMLSDDWPLRVANKWLIYLTADGADPVPGVDEPTEVDMDIVIDPDTLSGLLEYLTSVSVVQSDINTIVNGLGQNTTPAVLYWESSAQIDESDVRVLVRTRRDDGTTQSDSINTDVYSTTAYYWRAQGRRPIVSFGNLDAIAIELSDYDSPTIYIDESKNIRWEVDGEDVHLYADTVLIWSIRNSEIRLNVDLEFWNPNGSGSGTIEVGAWDVGEKTLWINVGGSHYWKIDVLNGVLYTADREFSDSLHPCYAPYPIWGAYEYTTIMRWDGESAKWVPAISIDSSGNAYFDVDIVMVGDETEAIS